MQQRVMIAIALSCDPALLIADNPTTALDVTIQIQILDLVKQLRERLGMAVLWITHDLGVVAKLCDRVVIMYAGEVMEEGDVYGVLKQPRHPYTSPSSITSRSEEHTSELQSLRHLVCRLLLEKKN